MADMSTEDIVAALSALGVSNTAAAQRVASISNTPEQALSHLGRISVGEESPRHVNPCTVVPPLHTHIFGAQLDLARTAIADGTCASKSPKELRSPVGLAARRR